MIVERLFANEVLRYQGILSRVLVAMLQSLKGTRFLREDEDSLRHRQNAKEVLERYQDKLTALLLRMPSLSNDSPQELKPPFLPLEQAARKRCGNGCATITATTMSTSVKSRSVALAG